MIKSPAQQAVRDPEEAVDVEQLIQDVVPDPANWKITPNPVLGGERPVDLIHTPREQALRDMLRAAKHAMVS